jgi:hypothetical protein
VHRTDHDATPGTGPARMAEVGDDAPSTLTDVALARGRDLGWEQLVSEFSARGPDMRFADLDDEALEQKLCRDASAITAAMCRWLELLGEFVRRGVWADQGARTPGAWLSWRLGIEGSTARDHVRVALRLRDLPAVRDRFAEGTLSYSKVRAITRVAVAASEEQLLRWADHATAAQLETIVRGLRTVQRAQRQEVPDGEDPRYRQQVRTLADGTAVLTLRGPAEEIVALEDGVRALADALVADRLGAEDTVGASSRDRPAPPHVDPAGTASDLDDGAPPRRATAADRVEALVHAVAVAAAAKVPVDTSGLDRHTLVVTVAGRDLATEPADDGPDPVPVRDTHGRLRSMDRRALRRLACQAGFVLAQVDDDGTPLDLGRRRRRLNAALRRAVHLRDRCCTFPGCHATRNLHVHHVQFWSEEGPTDLGNLALLCHFHHRFVHERSIAIEVRPDGRHRFTPTASAEALPAVGVLPRTDGAEARRAPSASAEALLPRGDIDLRPFDVDHAIAILLESYTRAPAGLALAV